jgi:hypothetical protein
MHSDQALELADALEIHGAQTLDFFRELTPAQFAIQVYPDGAAWTVHNLLAHFVEVEGSIRTLIERIVQGGPGIAEDFSIDRWNARYTAEMSQHDDAYLLAEFARRRAATVAMARGLTAADFEKRGRHPSLGVTEVKHMLKLMYVHLLRHQRDIRKALNEAQSVD